jgi:O-antigen ligase
MVISSATSSVDDPSSAPPAASGSKRWFTRERLLQLSLWAVGLMWTLPFLVPLKAPPVPSFHAEALAAVLGLLALCVLPAYATRLELPRVALLPLGLIGLIVLQLLLGRLVFRQVGLLGALYLLWATGLVMLGGLFRRELGLERVAVTLAWFLMAGALASAMVGWAQHIDSDALGRWMMPRSGDGRVWANLGQANQLGDYSTLGLASVAYLYGSGRLRLVWAVPATMALCYILSLTGSRTGWAYLAGLIALSGWFWYFARTDANRRFLGLCCFALIACILLPWLTGLLGGPDLPTAASRLATDSISSDQRPRMWKAALLMFLDSPLLGIGFRQFGWHHFLLNGEMAQPRVLGFTDHPHNLPLGVLTELGLVGLGLLAAFAVLWIAGLVRQTRTPAHWWAWAITLVLATHSMLEYPLWYTFFLGVAAVVLGLGEPRRIKLELGRQGRTGRILLVALLAMGWFVTANLMRDYLLLENFLAFRFRYIHATAEVNRQAKDLLLEIHRESLLAPYVELGLARTITVDRDRLEEKLTVNGRAMRLFPIDDVVYRQAMLLALRGDQAAAQRQWDLAVASFPEERDAAVLVLQRRVEDGLAELGPLLDYARHAR